MENEKIMENMTKLNIYQSINLFLCKGNQSEILTAEVYQELIRKGGPTIEKKKLNIIACDIQQTIKDHNKLQEILYKTG